jgi:hypothetical protein
MLSTTINQVKGKEEDNENRRTTVEFILKATN